MLHAPAPTKLTTPLDVVVHVDTLVEPKVTASPDDAVAVTWYVGPPGYALLGGVEVYVIDCASLIVKVCTNGVAAL
jgi:hypothetical protein